MQIPAHVRTAAVPAALEAAATLTPVLRRYPRARQALQYLVLAQTGYKAIQTFRSHFKTETEKETWTVTIKSDDSLYAHALDLLARQTETNWQAVEAELSWTYAEDEDGDLTREVPDVKARPSERVERNFILAGHPVFAYVETFAAPRLVGPSPTGMKHQYRTPEVVFVAESEQGQATVLASLKDIATVKQTERKKRKPLLYTQGSYRGWERGGELPIRPVESVAVTDNQVQRIVDDILAFRELEPEYVRRGIPFHRGYLLYGPPGTGKTSAIKAIAHAVGSDLYAANLGTMNDASLAEAVQGVSRSRNGAILLLEDIDSFDAARQRDEDDEGDQTGITAGISTTGLLNALDGVETPHGLITILTTNHPEFLDDALIRPGRVDKKIEFGYPDDATVSRHYEFFFSRKPSVPLFAAGRSGAELNEVFVAHMTDPEGAEKVLSVETLPPVEKLTVTPVRKPAPVQITPDPGMKAAEARLTELFASTPGTVRRR